MGKKNVICIYGGLMINVNVSVKNVMYVKKNYIWNPPTRNCENGKYLASIMNDSAITFDEVIESYDEETNFNEKKAVCKTQNFYILLVSLLITIALLIAYCYPIKYRAKQKHLLPFHVTNNELERFMY